MGTIMRFWFSGGQSPLAGQAMPAREAGKARELAGEARGWTSDACASKAGKARELAGKARVRGR